MAVLMRKAKGIIASADNARLSFAQSCKDARLQVKEALQLPTLKGSAMTNHSWLPSLKVNKSKGKPAAQVYACPADGFEQNNDKNKAAPEASTTMENSTVIPQAASLVDLAPSTTNTTNVNSVMTPAQVEGPNESTETGTIMMTSSTEAPGETSHTLESDTLTVNNSNTMEATPAAAPAKPSGLRQRLVNLTHQGVDLLTKPFEVAVKKMEETKIKIVERCKLFSATPAVSGSGRKVGEGQRSAAAAVVAAAAALPLTETAAGSVVSSKSSRGFWARKARWATKRSKEAHEKVKGCVTSAREGAQAKLRALKQHCSRKGHKKE